MKRRDMLKQGAAALAGAASASPMSAGAVAAQQPAGAGAASQTRRRFRAYIRMATGAAVREVQMLPLRDNMVAIRTEATQCCYTIVNQALGTGPAGGAGGAVAARILGHGGVGVVEAVGTQVTRVQPGDRVLVTNTPHCGECYSCLRRRGDICQMNPSAGEPLVPIGELEDGTPVHQHNNTGGFAELMITYDWYCVPAFTKASAAELAVLGCVGATGLGAVTTFVPVDFGESVVVMGAGPIGLSAVQGARIMGASPIICVEPIAVRRELALKMGATHVLDPNVEGDGLVRKVRDLVSAANPRKFLGGRDTNPDSDSRGADYVVATVGADVVPPTVERGPDPTALVPTRQAWEMTRAGGNLITLGLPRGNISLPAGTWSNRGRHHHAGQYGGVNAKSDVPRFVKLVDQGLFDAKSLVTATYPLERTREAFEAVGNRTTTCAVVVFG
jgi:S-(hydroxymethyl)glutathione dehydrogenase/alcohol dehydrogenase